MLKDLLRRGDWMAETDLKDAYFAVPISAPDKLAMHTWPSRSADLVQLDLSHRHWRGCDLPTYSTVQAIETTEIRDGVPLPKLPPRRTVVSGDNTKGV